MNTLLNILSNKWTCIPDDTTKLIVAFRNFASAAKKKSHKTPAVSLQRKAEVPLLQEEYF